MCIKREVHILKGAVGKGGEQVAIWAMGEKKEMDHFSFLKGGKEKKALKPKKKRNHKRNRTVIFFWEIFGFWKFFFLFWK